LFVSSYGWRGIVFPLLCCGISILNFEINKFGTKIWSLDGKLHRSDGPALEFEDGTKHWYKDGELHREDGPAVEHSDGSKEWYRNGLRHREDGPAIEHSDGYKVWFVNDRKIARPYKKIDWSKEGF
jgi:hypothetical protein